MALADDLLHHSVRRIGLLPRAMPNAEHGIVDTSGLGGQEGQLTPRPVQRVVGALTDEMRIVRERVAMGGGDHRPTLRNTEVDTTAYLPNILHGFTATYRVLLAEREALLAADGPLLQFKDDTIRIILRSTQTYMKLLSESYHPDLMRNALDREAFLDKLWIVVEEEPQMANVIDTELRDLQRGDTPLFTSQPGSTLIYDSDDRAVEGFVGETGLSSALRRVAGLSEEDLTRQCWIIKASISMLGKEPEAPAKQRKQQKPKPEKQAKRIKSDGCVAAASRVGDWLAQHAVYAGDEASWLGVDAADEQGWSVAEVGTDLYNGQAGIALFLGYLGRMTGNPRHMRLARQATNALLREREDWPDDIDMVGGFSGLGAMIYALTHVGVVLDDAALLDAAHGIVAYLPDRIRQDNFFDIIGGSAGCIGSLLALQQRLAKCGGAGCCAGLWRSSFGKRPAASNGYRLADSGIAYAAAGWVLAWQCRLCLGTERVDRRNWRCALPRCGDAGDCLRAQLVFRRSAQLARCAPHQPRTQRSRCNRPAHCRCAHARCVPCGVVPRCAGHCVGPLADDATRR